MKEGNDKAFRVEPRDAASLLLYRRRAGGAVDVLVGKRASGHRFMPDVYVFPGGAVDREDHLAVARGRLSASCIAHLGVEGDEKTAQALAMAAIRETFEEAGILVAESRNPDRLVDDVGNVAGTTWRRIAERGAVPLLSPLRYVARAVTPVNQPIRFHARFFAVDVDEVPLAASMEPRGNGELEDLRWVDASGASDLPIRPVTRFVFDEFLRLAASGERDWHGTRCYTQIDGRPVIE